MLNAGDVYENPVTGERAVIRIGTDTTGGELLVVDLHVQPGGAVIGEHLHPEMEERFTLLRGQRTLSVEPFALNQNAAQNGPTSASGAGAPT